MGTPYVDRIRDNEQPGCVYRVFANNKDVTDYVIGDITIDAQEDFIATATFNLNGRGFINHLSRFQKITIWGGSKDPRNQRYLFTGIIKKVDPHFTPEGVPFVTILAYSSAWRAARKALKIVYPSRDCERTWGRVEKIKLSEIVKKIMDENFYQMDVTINIKQDVEFTQKRPFVQLGTDWLALRELSRMSNCMLLELANDRETDRHIIRFVDRDSYLNNTEDKKYPLSFRYVPRDPENNFDFAVDETKEGEIKTDNIDFNIDVDLNSGSLRIVTDFSSSDEGKPQITHYDENTDELFLYELKPESHFRALSDDTVKRFWDKLSYEWEDVTLEDILPFFDKVDLSANTVPGYEDTNVGMNGAGKLGWVGYQIQVEVEAGDVNIEPYQYYPLYGIEKYSTKNNGKNKYYLRSMQQKLGAQYTQTLHFYR